MESLAVMQLFYLSNQGRLLRGGSIEQGQKEARERNGTIGVWGRVIWTKGIAGARSPKRVFAGASRVGDGKGGEPRDLLGWGQIPGALRPWRGRILHVVLCGMRSL